MNVAGLIHDCPQSVAKGSATGTLLQRVRHLAASGEPLAPLPPAFLQVSRLDHELWAGEGNRYQEGTFDLPPNARFHGTLLFEQSVARIYTSGSRAILLVENPSFSKMETQLWDRNEIDKRFETARPWDPQNQRRLPIYELPDSFKRGHVPYFLERKGPLPWLALHSTLNKYDFSSSVLRAPDAPFPTGAKLQLHTIFQRYPPGMCDEDTRQIHSIEQARICMTLLLHDVKDLILQHAHEDPEPALQSPSKSVLVEEKQQKADSAVPSETIVVTRGSPTHSSATDEMVGSEMLCAYQRPRTPMLTDLLSGIERQQIWPLERSGLHWPGQASTPSLHGNGDGFSSGATATENIAHHLFAPPGAKDTAETADVVLAESLIRSKFTDDVRLFDTLLYLGSLLQRSSALVLVDVTSGEGVIKRLVLASAAGVSPLDMDLARRLVYMSEATMLIIEHTSFTVSTPRLPKAQHMRLKIDQQRLDEAKWIPRTLRVEQNARAVMAADPKCARFEHALEIHNNPDNADTAAIGAAGSLETQSRAGGCTLLSDTDVATLLQSVNNITQAAVSQAVYALVGPGSNFERHIKTALDGIPSAVAAAVGSSLQSKPKASAAPSKESALRLNTKRSCDRVWDSVHRLHVRLKEAKR